MKTNKYPIKFLRNMLFKANDMFSLYIKEFKSIFFDRGVVIIFFIATLVYPILYSSLYKNETIVNTSIAVVDKSGTVNSRKLLRSIDATPDVAITLRCKSMEEAKTAFFQRKVHGIVYIPSEFDKKLQTNKQAFISIYCDMSSFLYYRALLQACNYSVLDMGKDIQIKRLNANGITGESALMLAEPIPFEGEGLYNKGMGFASFLMPAILILIIHQTLFFGITMLAGSIKEGNLLIAPENNKQFNPPIYQTILAKAASYFTIYLLLCFYILIFVPRLFNLPHIGSNSDIYLFLIPFLLATIFFSISFSVFFKNRETCMIIFLFFSLILLFLSGISWPMSNISVFWKWFGWLFPATHGIQAYIKINTMGGNLHTISFEYISLWTLTILYLITSLILFKWHAQNKKFLSL